MKNLPRKILIIGYGSIGRKHAQILKKFNCEIAIFTKQKNITFKTLNRKKEILEYNPDYIIISNNTNKHREYLKFLEKNLRKKIILTEKPLLDRYENIKLFKNKYLVGYNLRFHPVIQYIKRNLKKKNINFISVNVSTYLPKWRKNIDYKKSNSAKNKLGGGLLLELSHELDYIKWLFGNINLIYSFSKKISNLKISTDDILILFGSINKRIKVIFNMNFFSRINKREIIIEGNNFSLNADLIKNEVNLLSKNKVKKFFWKKFNILDTYRQEHKKVLNNEFENFCDIKQSLETLKLIKRIKDQKS